MCARARGRFSLEGDYIWTAARQVPRPAAEGLGARIGHGPLSWARAVLPSPSRAAEPEPWCRARAVAWRWGGQEEVLSMTDDDAGVGPLWQFETQASWPHALETGHGVLREP